MEVGLTAERTGSGYLNKSGPKGIVIGCRGIRFLCGYKEELVKDERVFELESRPSVKYSISVKTSAALQLSRLMHSCGCSIISFRVSSKRASS